MSWLKNVRLLLTKPVPPAWPENSLPTAKTEVAAGGKSAPRPPAVATPPSPLLAAQAAAAKAAAQIVRREQAATSARELLKSIGVQVPKGTVATTAPVPAASAAAASRPLVLTPQRKALLTEAMHHWANGHAIYERLDPGLKARIHAIAERLAPK